MGKARHRGVPAQGTGRSLPNRIREDRGRLVCPAWAMAKELTSHSTENKMKKIIEKIFSGKDNTVNGLIALAVIASIALGCNCNKSFDLNNSSSSSNSSSDNPFGNSSS